MGVLRIPFGKGRQAKGLRVVLPGALSSQTWEAIHRGCPQSPTRENLPPAEESHFSTTVSQCSYSKETELSGKGYLFRQVTAGGDGDASLHMKAG